MPVGERLKMARQGAGLSQRELAQKVGVSAMAISKYETGQDMPGSKVLLALCEALHLKVDYFFRSISINLSKPHYRRRSTLPKKQETRIHEQTRDWLERYLELEEIVNDIQKFVWPMEEKCRVSSLDEVEEVSQYIRDEWNLGTDPIENLTETFEQHGIKVGTIEGAEKFDALTFTFNDRTPVIAVKMNIPGDRQRFNLAHEFGHNVLIPAEDIDIEKAAHRFAGSFLVPKPMIIADFSQRRDTLDLYELHLLKHKYGISMQALIFRAKDLGIISDARATSLFKLFKQKGWHLREPGDSLPAEIPNRMKRLIFRALSENKISNSRAAELLGTDFYQFCVSEAEVHEGFPISICD